MLADAHGPVIVGLSRLPFLELLLNLGLTHVVDSVLERVPHPARHLLNTLAHMLAHRATRRTMTAQCMYRYITPVSKKDWDRLLMCCVQCRTGGLFGKMHAASLLHAVR